MSRKSEEAKEIARFKAWLARSLLVLAKTHEEAALHAWLARAALERIQRKRIPAPGPLDARPWGNPSDKRWS